MNNDKGRLFFATGIDNSQLRADAAESRNILHSIGQTANQEGVRMDDTFKKIAKAAGGIFAIGGATEFAKQIISVRGEIEKLEISFETLAGKSKGDALFAEIRQFAVSTPMMMKDLAQGAQTMLAFNIEVEKVMPMLRAIGDISMGDAQKFNSLSLAFSQMSATGKLMGQDLLQMINAGFNPLSVISEKTGKSIGNLKKEMEEGKISTDMVTEAFLAATSAGGKFYGMLEKQSHGINGAISNLQGAIEDMLNDFGHASQGIVAGVIDDATYLVKNYETVAEILAGLVGTYGVYKAAVIANEAMIQAATSAKGAAVKEAYESEIAALTALLPQKEAEVQTSLQQAVAAGQITKEKAAEIAAIRSEAQAQIEALAASEAAAKARLMASQSDVAAALKWEDEIKNKISTLEDEADALFNSGDSLAFNAKQEEIAALKAELLEIQKERETAVEAANTAATEMNSASHQQNAIATAEDSAATAANSAQTATNTSVTSALAIAKTKLIGVIKSLYATIAAHPYALAAAAIAALAYGIYRLATYETDAEKAQRRLNEAISQSQAEIDAERIQIDALFSALENAAEGTKSYESAKEAIIKQYGQYLEGLINEKGELLNIAEAYDRVKVAAENAARARALEASTKEAQDDYQKTVTEKYGKIAEKIRDEVDDSKLAETLIQLVNNDIANGGVMSSSTLDAINEAFGVKRAKNGKWTLDSDVTELKEFVADIRAAGKQLAQATHDAQIEFGSAINEFEGYSLEQLRDAKKQLSDDLKDDSITDFTILGGGVIMKEVDKKEEALLALQKLNDAIKSKEKAETPSGPTKSGADWAADKKKAYEDALKAYNDYVNGVSATSKNVSEAEYKKERARLKSELDAAKKEYDNAKPVIDKAAANDNKNANHTAVEIAERNRAIEEAKNAEIRAARDAALQVQQEKLDLEDDSTDKTLKQIELNKQRMENALTDREDDLLEKYRDIVEKQWQNDNPDAKDKGLAFDRSSVTKSDMMEASNKDGNEWLKDALAAIAASRKVMNDTIVRQTNEAYKDMLGDVLTYEQQRTKIAQEYARKRESFYEKNEDGTIKTDAEGNKVLRQGVTQGNLDELKRQEDEALKAVDEQFAQREETYQAWCETIANLSLKELNGVLEQAKKNLEELEKANPNDPKLAQARAKVNTAQAAANKAEAKNEVNPGARSIKEWEDLYRTLSDVEKEFESIGDTVGGVVGEIISQCGQFVTSTLQMINGVKTLSQSSTKAIDETGKATAKSISTVEKASVILTVISAALQIATQIASLFNDDEKKQKEIEHLQDRIDQLSWELDHQEVGRVQQQYGSAIERLNKALARSRVELAAGQRGWRNLVTLTGRASRNQELMQKTADKLAQAYSTMSYTADKALGADKYKQANDQLKNLAQQQILIQEQIRAEQSKKKSDSGQIQQWQNKIEELGQQAIEIINEMVEDIIGDTSTGIANELADAFIDAFQAGEDAAEAWGDKVNEIVADVLKRMLISKFLEEPLGDIFDKYKAKWFKDGQFQGLDSVINSMEGFAGDLNAVGADFAEIWENLPDSVKNMFTITSDSEREASQKGIATASQESVDELNGRATAIQGHTFSISENTKTILVTTQAILRSVMNIESETTGLGERMGRMEGSIRDMAGSLDNIATKGIRLKT